MPHPTLPHPLPTTVDLRSMVTRHLLSRSLKALADADARRDAAFHGGDWQAYRASVRQQAREAFGEMPFGATGRPLNVRAVSTFEIRSCRIENVLFESFPGWEVNASVFVPRGDGPFPAVVIPVGHSGKQYENYQIPAQAFASLGYLAVLFDPPGQDSEKKPGNDHFYDGVRTFLTGPSSSRYFVLDALRCIDYLETREDADTSRGVGMTGVSGGGHTALFASLFDDRIACQGPSCCLAPMADHPVGDAYSACPESMWSGRIAAGVDELDILLAAIPVPTLYMAGRHDEVFRIEWSRSLADTAGRSFAQAGYEDRFRFFEDESGHAYTLDQVEQFAAWMNRWLLGDPARTVPALDPGDYDLLDYDMLKCHPAPEANIFTLNRDLAHDLASRRDPHPGRDALRTSIRRVISTPISDTRWQESSAVPLWTQTFREVLFTAEGLEVPATLLRPTDDFVTSPERWLVYIDDAGRRAALESWGPAARLSQMLDRNAEILHLTILLPDLPGWGDSRPTPVPYTLTGWGSMDRLTAYLSCALGDGILAIQTRAAANLIQHLICEQNTDPGAIILIGRGLGGIAALLAGALVPGIGGIVSWSTLARFASLAEDTEYTWPSAAFLPDVLPHFDLPEVIRSLDTAPILILDPLDARHHSLSATEADSIFAPIPETVQIVPECAEPDAIQRIEELVGGEHSRST